MPKSKRPKSLHKINLLNLSLMKKLIFMLMAVICFTACSNDDNDPQKPINPEQPKAVELNDTTLTFELNADTATVNIGSSEGWWI